MITPSSLGQRPTTAIGAPFGKIVASQLAEIIATRDVVVLHRLGGAKEREIIGPRELREATCAALDAAGWPERWALGGVCVEVENAANFAIGGYSWFTFDVVSRLDAAADSASLDELDAAIVALEDAGIFPQGWHEAYLGADVFGTPFDDESLARAAVKFGRALEHAEQLQQVLRTTWSGRGDMPDIEVSIARAFRRTTKLELYFLAMELKRRGVWTSVIAPSLGPDFQAGLAPTESPDVTDYAEILASAGAVRLSAPGAAHEDKSDAAFFAMLRGLAEKQPGLFREMLLAARDAFPLVRTGWSLSIGDDDVMMMPEVDDDALASTFLDSFQGRQLLLCTWDAVCETFGGRLRSALGV